MSDSNKDNKFAQNTAVTTRSYRGPNRRRRETGPDDAEIVRRIKQDELGNPVLEVRTVARRRRQDDDTVDLLKCLGADDISLEPSDE